MFFLCLVPIPFPASYLCLVPILCFLCSRQLCSGSFSCVPTKLSTNTVPFSRVPTEIDSCYLFLCSYRVPCFAFLPSLLQVHFFYSYQIFSYSLFLCSYQLRFGSHVPVLLPMCGSCYFFQRPYQGLTPTPFSSVPPEV